MTDLDKVRAALGRLPIFPLPGAVLLPHALVPLHIFEPRYRKMTRDCLATGNGVLALAHILPASLRAGETPPQVQPVLGVGVFAKVEPLPDGRYNLLLKGVLRARILEEMRTDEPYRLVRAVELPEPPEDAAAQAAGDELRRLLLGLCGAMPGAPAQAIAGLSAKATTTGHLADAVAAALIDSPHRRQAVLEAQDVRQRARLAGESVTALLARSAGKADRSHLN